MEATLAAVVVMMEATLAAVVVMMEATLAAVMVVMEATLEVVMATTAKEMTAMRKKLIVPIIRTILVVSNIWKLHAVQLNVVMSWSSIRQSIV